MTRAIDLDRFWAKVDKDGPVPEHAPELGPCWLWTAAISSSTGYGSFRATTAHRWIWIDLHGPLPHSAIHVDHLCRVRACVNPSHLEAVTSAENQRRGLVNQHKGKTHCKHGHEFTPENTYLCQGGRHCRTCLNRRNRESDRRRRAARKAAECASAEAAQKYVHDFAIRAGR